MKLCLVQAKTRPAPSVIVETVILSCAAVLWIWSGCSTWSDLIGKPHDAPFLMIPGHLRAIFFWWIPGLFALYTSRSHRYLPIAFFLLALGPIVRLASYVVSWVASWSSIDPLIPDNDLQGDPRAWGSAWIYAALIIGLAGFTYLCTLMRRYEKKVIRLEAENSNLRNDMAELAKGR